MTDFGDPVYVEELPPATNRGGRASITPAITAWIGKIAPGKTAELPATDDKGDGAHSVGRVTQVRNVAKEGFPGYNVDTRAVESGKRYRIFVTNTNEDDGNGKTPRK